MMFLPLSTRFGCVKHIFLPPLTICTQIPPSSNMSSFELINVAAPSQPLPTPNAYKIVKFARITEKDTSEKKKAPMNARSVASDIPLNKLMVSAEQFTALQDIVRVPVPMPLWIEFLSTIYSSSTMGISSMPQLSWSSMGLISRRARTYLPSPEKPPKRHQSYSYN
ncbi:hypothetical protein B0H14DRAFT_1228755 [Mycena olivaceomarginata]|nr:hypothetical protein B0H14DRAFT_1228755 [Mycena olivaceomarginata]